MMQYNSIVKSTQRKGKEYNMYGILYHFRVGTFTKAVSRPIGLKLISSAPLEVYNLLSDLELRIISRNFSLGILVFYYG
jgi:hypothetical protein